MKGRYRSGSITIDVSEYIAEVDDETIIEEFKERKLSLDACDADPMELVEEAHRELLRGRVSEARVILERLVYPKWRDQKAAQTAYEEARKSA